MTEEVFNAEAIKRALEVTIADHPPPLVVIMPAAWRELITANPHWIAGVRVFYDDEVYTP